jgi:hypothetical protein
VDLLALAATVTGLLLLRESWWAILLAPVLAVVSTQIAFFGHDAGHRQITRRRGANDAASNRPVSSAHGSRVTGPKQMRLELRGGLGGLSFLDPQEWHQSGGASTGMPCVMRSATEYANRPDHPSRRARHRCCGSARH